MATIFLVSPKHFEPWSWATPDTTGIGGSETMHCELAWRLAARGHRVVSYVPLPADYQTGGPWFHRGVEWRDLTQADYRQPGLWILVRGLRLLEYFPDSAFPVDPSEPRQDIWCVFQDVDEPGPLWKHLTPHLHKMTRLITLCQDHYDYHVHARPELAATICLSRNGLRGEMVDEVLAEGRERQPHCIGFASSPDRGMYGALRAFKLIRFLVPDAELHLYYGLDNISKVAAKSGSVRWNVERLKQVASQPGVVWHGRLAQPDLYRAWAQTALWLNPTNFLETGCITAMEAQALGAIPVCNPIWAAGENMLAGIGIEGEAETDPLQLRRYAMACVYLLEHPEIQAELRPGMMTAARKNFDWDDVVSQYQDWMITDGIIEGVAHGL